MTRAMPRIGDPLSSQAGNRDPRMITVSTPRRALWLCLPIRIWIKWAFPRQALNERGLLWAVGLSRRENVYPADVALVFPVAKTGKCQQVPHS